MIECVCVSEEQYHSNTLYKRKKGPLRYIGDIMMMNPCINKGIRERNDANVESMQIYMLLVCVGWGNHEVLVLKLHVLCVKCMLLNGFVVCDAMK